MSRYVFKPGDQHKFMVNMKNKLACSWEKIGTKVGLSSRTLRDWQREILLGNKDVLHQLSLLSNIPLPIIVEEREEWWNAKKWQKEANRIRLKIHGSPGTTEGRSKGGKISQMRRLLYPERYAGTRTVLRKKLHIPAKSVRLAELIGILLGDGNLSKEQMKISLNLVDDKKFSEYVCEILFQLFGIKASVYTDKKYHVNTVCISSVELIEFLTKNGLCVGSKMKANVGIPSWIKCRPDYSRACIRGLVDTDGCFFIHKYKVNNKTYEYKKISFVSYIPKLMEDVKNQLISLGFTPKVQGAKRLFLYNQQEAKRYLEEIGTSNPKNFIRWGINNKVS